MSDRATQAREIADDIIAGSKYEIPEGATRFMVRDLLESMFFAVMSAIEGTQPHDARHPLPHSRSVFALG